VALALEERVDAVLIAVTCSRASIRPTELVRPSAAPWNA
jgi:hypothetical protein